MERERVMGERGAVQFLFEDNESVYLYTHWRADNLRELVQRGLKGVTVADRFHDPAYAVHTMMAIMWEGESHLQGWGVSPFEPAGLEHPLVVVDFPLNLVYEKDLPGTAIHPGGEGRDVFPMNTLAGFAQEGTNPRFVEHHQELHRIVNKGVTV